MKNEIKHTNLSTASPVTQPRFQPGRIVATPGALQAMEKQPCSPLDLLHRHVYGDWGDVPPDDAAMNEDAVKFGNRIISSYRLKASVTIWLITEADRSYSTFLLPSEY